MTASAIHWRSCDRCWHCFLDRPDHDHPAIQRVAAALHVACRLQPVDQGGRAAGADAHQLGELPGGQGIELHHQFQRLQIRQGDPQLFRQGRLACGVVHRKLPTQHQGDIVKHSRAQVTRARFRHHGHMLMVNDGFLLQHDVAPLRM